MDEFYVTLSSNASTDLFPSNNQAEFKNVLLRNLELGYNWEVGLAEIIYPSSWYNITEDHQEFALMLTVPNTTQSQLKHSFEKYFYYKIELPPERYRGEGEANAHIPYSLQANLIKELQNAADIHPILKNKLKFSMANRKDEDSSNNDKINLDLPVYFKVTLIDENMAIKIPRESPLALALEFREIDFVKNYLSNNALSKFAKSISLTFANNFIEVRVPNKNYIPSKSFHKARKLPEHNIDGSVIIKKPKKSVYIPEKKLPVIPEKKIIPEITKPSPGPSPPSPPPPSPPPDIPWIYYKVLFSPNTYKGVPSRDGEILKATLIFVVRDLIDNLKFNRVSSLLHYLYGNKDTDEIYYDLQLASGIELKFSPSLATYFKAKPNIFYSDSTQFGPLDQDIKTLTIDEDNNFIEYRVDPQKHHNPSDLGSFVYYGTMLNEERFKGHYDRLNRIEPYSLYHDILNELIEAINYKPLNLYNILLTLYEDRGNHYFQIICPENIECWVSGDLAKILDIEHETYQPGILLSNEPLDPLKFSWKPDENSGLHFRIHDDLIRALSETEVIKVELPLGTYTCDRNVYTQAIIPYSLHLKVLDVIRSRLSATPNIFGYFNIVSENNSPYCFSFEIPPNYKFNIFGPLASLFKFPDNEYKTRAFTSKPLDPFVESINLTELDNFITFEVDSLRHQQSIHPTKRRKRNISEQRFIGVDRHEYYICKIPVGHYSSMEEIFKAMQNAVPDTIDPNVLQLTLQQDGKVNIKINSPLVKIHLDWGLGYMLGFSYEQMDAPYFQNQTSDNVADLQRGIHIMYIYSDLILPQLVGNTEAPLLRVAKIENQNNNTETFQNFFNIDYFPLRCDSIQIIEIALKTDFNEYIPFKLGRTVLKLHFRRNVRS